MTRTLSCTLSLSHALMQKADNETQTQRGSVRERFSHTSKLIKYTNINAIQTAHKQTGIVDTGIYKQIMAQSNRWHTFIRRV